MAIFASGGGFAEPFGIVKSSRPWRQILPQAKFPCLRAFSTLCHDAVFLIRVSCAAAVLPSERRSALPFPVRFQRRAQRAILFAHAQKTAQQTADGAQLMSLRGQQYVV